MTSKMRMVPGLVATLLAMGAQAAHAQSCVGLPSLTNTSKLLSMSATGSGADRLVLSRFAWSGQRMFLGLQAGYAANEFKKPHSPVFGIDAGYSFQLGASKKLELCPVLQSTWTQHERFTQHDSDDLTWRFAGPALSAF